MSHGNAILDFLQMPIDFTFKPERYFHKDKLFALLNSVCFLITNLFSSSDNQILPSSSVQTH